MLKFIYKELRRYFFIEKHKKWTLEQKNTMVKEFKAGASIPYLNKKYGISGMGTISRWNQAYDKGTIAKDNRGKKNIEKIEDIDILKKCYALLMEIRNKQHK